MEMDLRQIEYFTEVAKQLSFTKAAATLHVSQPSISKAIQNLETELGVPLFYRSSKQLELTDAGEAVLKNAKQVLAACQNLQSEVSDLSELKKGRIRIGIPPIVGAAFFSKLISHYKEKYPYVDIILTEVGTKQIRRDIDKGELDIGLVCSATSPNENLETICFLRDPLQLIVHQENPIAALTSANIEDLRNESFIMYRNDFVLYDQIFEQCKKADFYPTIACETTQKDLFIEMVQAKLGIALLPQKIADKIQYDSIRVIDFSNNPIYLELGITWKKNKYLSFAVREFIEVAKQFQLD